MNILVGLIVYLTTLAPFDHNFGTSFEFIRIYFFVVSDMLVICLYCILLYRIIKSDIYDIRV